MDELDLFLDAPKGGSPKELARYLDEVCGGDEVLRARVERLMAAESSLGGFMERTPRPALSGVGQEWPGTTIGNYRLEEELGRGGFGVVYRAEQLAPVRRQVAVKVIKLGMDTEQVIARFEAERQALAMMDHSGIAKVFDAGSTDAGRPFFAMELVEGMRITDYCAARGLGLEARLRLFVDVCQAVQHAHQKGVIHRDLKPSNILVGDEAMTSDESGANCRPRLKIIDFGVAKATQSDVEGMTLVTRDEQLVGTPAYMSPEQAALGNRDIDTRSDVYSLGVLLYELLTGTTPFDGKTLANAGQDEIRRTVAEDDPEKPSARAGGRGAGCGIHPGELRGDLDWIVMKALEKERGERYQTANALAMDVQRHLADEPVTAGRPGSGYLLRKFVRRHRFLLGAGAAVAVALLIGTVVSSWLAVEAGRARAAAERNERILAFRLVDDAPATETPGLGLAQLARFVRDDPRDRVAGERLVAALVQREYVAPELAPIADAQRAWFSPDGSKFVTVHAEKQLVRVWETVSGAAAGPAIKTDGPVLRAEFSPDGKWVATSGGTSSSAPGRAQVWDWATGGAVGAPIEHPKYVQFARFSPDGQRLFTADDGGLARITEVATGRELLVLRLDDAVLSGAWSPDGERVATAAADGTVGVWGWDTSGEPVSVSTMAHAAEVWSVRFHPEGGRLLTASSDGTARMWVAETGEASGEVMRHRDRVETAEFSADGALVVTGSSDRTARVWSAETGEAVGDSLPHQGRVWVASFSADSRRVVTGSDSGRVQVWDAATGAAIGPVLRHGKRVLTAGFSRDGAHVLTATEEEVARLWPVRSGGQRPVVFRHRDRTDMREQGRTVKSAVFSADGGRMVSVAAEPWVRVWDAGSGEALGEFKLGNPQWACFNGDGSRVLMASETRGARIWDMASGAEICAPIGSGYVRYAEFSPDPAGRWVVTASVVGKQGQVWDAGSGEAASEALAHDGWVTWATFSRDGLRIATCDFDGSVKVARWGFPNRDQVEMEGHRGAVWQVRFSTDGSRLVTASADGTARIWDAVSGAQVGGELAHFGAVNTAEFSGHGRWVVTASDDRTARVWDAATGVPIGMPMRHGQGVRSASFSRDGRRVVTASEDGTARVWDAATGFSLSEPLRHDGAVVSASFSEDDGGCRVVTNGDDLTARVWDVTPAPAGEVPGWVAEWAEAVAGVRLDEQDAVSVVGWEALRRVRTMVGALGGDGYYVRSAKRFFGDLE